MSVLCLFVSLLRVCFVFKEIVWFGAFSTRFGQHKLFILRERGRVYKFPN